MAEKIYGLNSEDKRKLEQIWNWFRFERNKHQSQTMRWVGSGGGGVRPKLYMVLRREDDDGDGVYQCVPAVIVADNWGGQSGTAKYTTTPEFETWDSGTAYDVGDYCIYGGQVYKSVAANNTNHTPEEGAWWTVDNTIYTAILNMGESDVGSDYSPALVTRDLMVTWPVINDEGSSVRVGSHVGPFVRRAITTEAVPASDHITCNIIDVTGAEITTGLGAGVEVYGDIFNATALDDCMPRLTDDGELCVVNIGGVWRATGLFGGFCIGDGVTCV